MVRYFGSKTGLLAAAIDIDIDIDIDLCILDLIDAPADEHGERLVEHFLSRWDAGTVEGQLLRSLLRSATGGGTGRPG